MEAQRQARAERPREPRYVGVVLCPVAAAAAAVLTSHEWFDTPARYRPPLAEMLVDPFFFWVWVLVAMGGVPFLLAFYVRGVWFPLASLAVCGCGAYAAYAVLADLPEDAGMAALFLVPFLLLCLVAAGGVAAGAVLGHGATLLARRRRDHPFVAGPRRPSTARILRR